jgi:hypothetical protein
MFWLLEASRPIDDNFVNKTRDTPMSKEEKDRLTESWVLDVFQPLLMYKYFLETFLNQLDDHKVKDIKRIFKDGKLGGFAYVGGKDKKHVNLAKRTLDLVREHNKELKVVPIGVAPIRYYITYPQAGNKRIFYDLDEKMYKKVTDTFKKTYPEIYWQLIKESVNNDPRGAKNNYVRQISDIPKVPE